MGMTIWTNDADVCGVNVATRTRLGFMPSYAVKPTHAVTHFEPVPGSAHRGPDPT